METELSASAQDTAGHGLPHTGSTSPFAPRGEYLKSEKSSFDVSKGVFALLGEAILLVQGLPIHLV